MGNRGRITALQADDPWEWIAIGTVFTIGNYRETESGKLTGASPRKNKSLNQEAAHRQKKNGQTVF